MMLKFIQISSFASILGGSVGCFRIFFTDSGFLVWGLGDIEPLLGLISVLWLLGMAGFCSLHVSKQATYAALLGGGAFAICANGIALMILGNPVGSISFLLGVLIMGGYCAWQRVLGRQSFHLLVIALVGISSWLPYSIIMASQVPSDSWFYLTVGLIALLFNLGWITLGIGLWGSVTKTSAGLS